MKYIFISIVLLFSIIVFSSNSYAQDEFFIKNYAMQPAENWTTLRNIEKDRKRLIDDNTYRNYLIFLYQVKNRMNVEWNKLIVDIQTLNTEILTQVKVLKN